MEKQPVNKGDEGHPDWHSKMNPNKYVPVVADVKVGPHTQEDELMKAVLSATADAGRGDVVTTK